MTFRISAAALALLFAATLPGHANDTFYQGNRLRFLIGHPHGSPGYDIFGRIVARHLSKHIPGNPTIVVENMPGAASLTMMNYLYNVAPKDGSVVGQAAKSVLLEPLYGNNLARFDPLKLQWIGLTQSDVAICYTLKPGAATIDEALAREVVIGSNVPAADSFFIPNLANHVIGTRFKPVLGYPGGPDVALAIERKEVEGACGFTLAAVKNTRPQWFVENRINILFQATLERSKVLPDVPAIASFAKDPSARQVLEVALGNAPLMGPIALPPGAPAERVEVLRRALDAVSKDPAFIADAQKLQYEIDPMNGESVHALLTKLYTMPREVVDKVVSLRKR